MFSEMHYPYLLSPRSLDDYLAKGWFRMGQMIFTCHYIFFKGQVYTPVWIRLDLTNYTFRKGLRKLLRKNGSQFSIVTRKARFDAEKEALYQKHRTRFEGYVSGTLKESLLDKHSDNIYDTMETLVYDGDRLVALSFFDLGDESMASIMGLFDPDYHKHSLGFYTMLLEIEFGIRTKRKFYYPGYVVEGYDAFDYKLRIGETDFYDLWSNTWKPYEQLNVEELPAIKLQNKLHEMERLLAQEGLRHQRYNYPLYDRGYMELKLNDFVLSPMIIICFCSHYSYLIEYDLLANKYYLYNYGQISDLSTIIQFTAAEGNIAPNTCLDYLHKKELIACSYNPTDIVRVLIHEVEV